MNILCDLIRSESEYGQILKNLDEGKTRVRRYPSLITGLCEGAVHAFLASLASDKKGEKPALIIVPDEKTAIKISNALKAFGLVCDIYPVRDPVLYNMVSSHELEQDRIGVLRKILAGKTDVVIASCDAVTSYTIPKETLLSSEITLETGKEYSIETLRTVLTANGYNAADLVDGKGQFAVRGGIVDIFPPQSEKPVRIDFFGDEIEKMYCFDPFTQRKNEKIKSLEICCSREILVDADARKKIAKSINGLLAKCDAESEKILKNELQVIENESDINFADKYISLVYNEKTTLLDYLGSDVLTCVIEYSAIEERMNASEFIMNESITDLLGKGLIQPKYAEYSKPKAYLYSHIENSGALIINNFESKYQGKLENMYSFKTRIPPAYTGSFEAFSGDLRMYALSGSSTVILCESETEAKSLENLMNEAGLKAHYISNYFKISNIKEGEFILTLLNVSGFELIGRKFICISLGEKTRQREATYRRHTSKKNSAKERLMSYADLTPGDYVVHDIHGIGRFVGIESVLNYEKVRSDHLKIEYANNTVLYVPCDKIDSISKYIGVDSDSETVRLSHLGTNDWHNTKSRVKQEVRNMAKELSKLYAERLRLPGFACEPDDDMQREFESTFEYVETEGQLIAAKEIKDDMEKPYPMDRLLCGDVGFGKTEVALRAAFKAIDNLKQVAILVPTTILALQHYQTITARMRKYPIKVAMLSRFVPAKERTRIIRAVARGDIDILVGTHRILSEDVTFADLGLVIVDEEQRFGVAQKEKLKQRCRNVDVLTLSATPIPRTLNMAMSDIRDMSVLDEAPVDRLPVQTYVLEYDTSIIFEAIRRELRRAGQVFFLHNDIETIASRAAQIKEEFPEARVAVAHGRMDKEELSDIWQDLVNGEIDVLVCTTIIETGVDVPNANTLIIENADRMGLSQLHQIRGRVGRSSRRAYAYFTFMRGRNLTEIQTKRLQAIRDFTEFGSGFKIALRDLEIRGAGDVLGAKQSGHLESVGYDMYIKILNEVMLEESGKVIVKPEECLIDISTDAYIPEQYISSPGQRIEAYKKIAHIQVPEDLDDVTDELRDRYGKLPVPVESLITVSLLRALGTNAGFMKIERRGRDAVIFPRNLDIVKWSFVTEKFPGQVVIIPSKTPTVTCKNRANVPLLGFLKEIMVIYSSSGNPEDKEQNDA